MGLHAWNSVIDARKSMVYSYTSFNAFAAHLTKDEAQKLLGIYCEAIYICSSIIILIEIIYMGFI